MTYWITNRYRRGRRRRPAGMHVWQQRLAQDRRKYGTRWPQKNFYSELRRFTAKDLQLMLGPHSYRRHEPKPSKLYGVIISVSPHCAIRDDLDSVTFYIVSSKHGGKICHVIDIKELLSQQ